MSDKPTRYLGLQAFAQRVGLERGTISRYLHKGYLPTPDVLIVDGSREARGWTEASIDEWMANRPGRGARTDLHK